MEDRLTVLDLIDSLGRPLRGTDIPVHVTTPAQP